MRITRLDLSLTRSSLDPAYGEIGPNTCVGMTGGWASYSWPPAIVLVAVMVIFLMDLFAERLVEMKYGSQHDHSVESMITRTAHNHGPASEEHTVPAMVDEDMIESVKDHGKGSVDMSDDAASVEKLELLELSAFRQQIAAFMILEFGVIFHSVIIGKLPDLGLPNVNTERSHRPESWYCWARVQYALPCPCLPSIVRRSWYWCSHVRHSISKRHSMAAVCIVFRVRPDYTDRNRHWTWFEKHLRRGLFHCGKPTSSLLGQNISDCERRTSSREYLIPSAPGFSSTRAWWNCWQGTSCLTHAGQRTTSD